MALITDTLHADLCVCIYVYIYDNMSLSYYKNEKYFTTFYRENQNTNFNFSTCFLNFFFLLWGNTEIYYEYIEVQVTNNIILRIRIARWISKATSTHSQYLVIIYFQQNNGY